MNALKIPDLTPIAAITITVAGLVCLAPLAAETMTPSLDPGREDAWRFVSGQWRMTGELMEQDDYERLHSAILEEPAFADFTMTVDVNVRPDGSGVRAAALIFRATGTMTYYWLHLDTKNRSVILTRSDPSNTWIEIKRVRHPLSDDAWHTVQVTCIGPEIKVLVDEEEVLTATDDAIPSGRIGLGTSQGRAAFRNLTIEGEALTVDQPLKDETPPHKIISRGEAAGPYQAFPDACRLSNGDIAVVFYAGYGHVSLPNDEWPKGGRICMVRSADEGRTWTEPQIVYDDADDNRDPHIAQMTDGTVICSFFSLRSTDSGRQGVGVQILRSADGGNTWEENATVLVPGWYCSAPVREMPDGTYVLGVYYEKGQAYGGVVRSTDRGQTWGEPISIGKGAGIYLDAETDVILLGDGTLYAALRSSKVNMHYSTSKDMGLTWAPVQDIGFRGHAPHFTRLSTGEILLTHRIPETALHVSRDECETWEGPYSIDYVGGAYPSTVELSDKSIMAIYYEEGGGSAVRALRFRLGKDGIERLLWE